MSDGHLNGLDLCMFGWNRADLVGDLISFHRHIFTLDAVGRMEVISLKSASNRKQNDKQVKLDK